MKKILLIIASLLFITVTSAQWSTDPASPQSLGSGIQAQVAATSDGGVYVAWLTDGNYHVYIQRLDAAGEAQIGAINMLVSDNNNSSWIAVYHLNLAVDGDDNAIITTVDERTGIWEVYAWKIAPDGSMLWGEDGVAVTAFGASNMSPRLTVLPDNSVVVTCTHNNNTVLFQRISSDGTLLWGDGIQIEDNNASLVSPQPTVTVESNVLIQWIRQTGSPPYYNSELYLQTYDLDGNPQWMFPIVAAGPVVFPMGNWSQQSVAEAGGGSFSAWTQFSGNVQNAVTQHITGEGALAWTGGVDLSTNSSNFRISPMLAVGEETQELMAVWREANSGQSQHGVYAQRLDSGGNRLWGSTGTAVVALNGSYDYLDLSMAGFGEEMISAYIQQSTNMNGDIYAARLDADGNLVWMDGTVTVTNSGSPKSDMMAGKGMNCLFIAWTENGSVYAHCLRDDGTLGAPDLSGGPGDILLVPSEYATIQDAINASENRDTVLVAPGTYVENINYSGKNIVIGSYFLTYGMEYFIEQTVIDGDSSGSVVTFDNGEDSTAVLSGFTIQNGSVSSGHGGGIYCHSSNPTLENVTISNNSASGNGGGIYCHSSSPSLENVTVSNNSAGSGGGISCTFSSPSLENVTVSNNSADDGGGIRCTSSSSPTLENVTITGNSAVNGGGLVLGQDSNSSLENVMISGNSAGSGGGIWCATSSPTLENVTITGNSSDGVYLIDFEGYLVSLVNCILWNDTPQEIVFGSDVPPGSVTATYSDIQGGWEGEGNIDADPLFCNPDSSDYTLAENSPCVGTGENGADMGAFGVGCEPINTEAIVNFSFDLTCYHGIFEELSGGYTPYIKGNWNNWDNSIPMSDENGDHIWTASANLPDGEYIFYVYATGPWHYFTLLAPIGSECDYYHDDPYGNWGFEINDSTDNELNLPTYSPNSCGECSTNEYFYLTHDGHERFYIVHLPDGYEDLNEDIPLILNLHAYSKYALYQQLMTGMEYWSDMQNVITVYPQAISGPGGVRAWNCGINGNPGFPTPDVDDVGFLSALIDTLVENYSIDSDRIYSCGISNGGFMSYKLACELNDKITAIGSVVGTFAESDADECSIERFMPVMDFHGTYDTVVPYEGAEGWMSVDETIAFWTGHNETDMEETYEYPDIVIEDNSTVNRFTYTNSNNNVQVVQFQIVGGGHEWPGAGYNGGWNNYDVNAGVELVDFFLQYRLSDFLYVNNNDPLPRSFSLHQNYPNPFNPVTTLSYDLPEDATVSITIYDMMGRVVKTLVNIEQTAGYKSVQWNATNHKGAPVSAGIYLYMIQAGEFKQTRKMVLLK